MASFQTMLDGALFLIVSTLTIMTFWVAGSPIMDFLSVYVASFEFTNPTVFRMAAYAQPIFGWWYWILVILEIGVFIRTYFIIATDTVYGFGESNF